MASEDQSSPNGIEVRTEFVRHRNVLIARARLTDLFLDYYLHMAETGLQMDPAHDALLKDMLSSFVLHCASRPRNEMIAWTISLQDPRLNLFATADSELGSVVGRVFTENIRKSPQNVFFQETVRTGQPVRRSVVDFTGADLFAAAETFYAGSEQRPGRFFDLGEEDFVLLSAHPDCDLGWLRTVDVESVRSLTENETLVPIERRWYRWYCGCNETRMFQILTPSMQQDADGLFGNEPTIRIECPRCNARYVISREALEAHVAEHGADS